MPVRALVSDLGGVVIRIAPGRVVDHWSARSPLPRDAVAARFEDDVYRSLERGEVSRRDYLAHVRAWLRFTGSVDELVVGFNDLFLGIDGDVVALLERRRADGALLVALTNTNVIHHPVWSHRFAHALAVFDHVHCSHLLGARKPEPAAFARVLELHGLAPSETVFVDDNEANVLTARRLGLHGVLFRGADRLAARLDALAWA